MNQDQAVKLLFARWGREFNDPPITDQQVDVYYTRVAKYEFTVEQIAAGIERYAEVFEYGQRRNWATLLKCCNEVRNAGKNIMPSGVAADLFVSGIWGCHERVQRLGYDPISANYYIETLRRLGDGIGQEETKYARLKFIQMYESLIDYEMSIEGQSAKRLSAAIQEREQLTDGNTQVDVSVNKLAKDMRL